jgi:nitrate/TMAO reductase-like tetraheme cytochrome c subunit
MQPTTGRQTAAMVLGIFVSLGLGIGSYTFLYAQGWSYLTNNPAACANCHIVQDHDDAWIKSSRRNRRSNSPAPVSTATPQSTCLIRRPGVVIASRVLST